MMSKVGFDEWMERAFMVVALIVICIILALALYAMVIIARSIM